MSTAGTDSLSPAAQAKFDPYLLAALLNRFAYYDDRVDGGDSPLLSVGFTIEWPAHADRTRATADVARWLPTGDRSRMTSAHLRPLARTGRAYVTADVTPLVLNLLGQAPFVTEVQLCANVVTRRPLPPRAKTARSPERPPPRTTRKRILATIDHGCAFAHQMLRQGDNTRVWALWDQDPRPDFEPAQGSVPTGYGYGRQVDRAYLNQCIAPEPPEAGWNEDRCYERARYDAVGHRMTHGTWVMGQLGGAMASPSLTASGRAEPDTDADDADLIFVQLPRAVPMAPSVGSIDRAVLDGLRYIADCAPNDAEIAVVIDYGTDMGPHDGSSWFERALDALVDELRTQRNVQLNAFYAAGNTHDAQRHAVLWGDTTARQLPARLPWWLPMSNAAPVAMELWFAEESPACTLQLQPPGGGAPLTIDLAAGDWLGTAPGLVPAQCVVVSLRRRGPQGGAGWQRQVLIEVGPTQEPDAPGGAPGAPAGVWTLTLSPSSRAPLRPVHAYTCWGGKNPGLPQRTWAPRFIAPPPGTPQNGPVQVTGNGSVLGSGCGGSNQVWMVGAYEHWGQRLRAPYSSGGGVRGGKRAAPLGVPQHLGADWLAPSDQSSALPGLLLLGTRSATRTRGRGTSFAAPQAARRWLAGTLATQPPPIQPPEPYSVRLPRAEYHEPRIVARP